MSAPRMPERSWRRRVGATDTLCLVEWACSPKAGPSERQRGRHRRTDQKAAARIDSGDLLAIEKMLKCLERRCRSTGIELPIRFDAQPTEATSQGRELQELLAQAEGGAKVREQALQSQVRDGAANAHR